MFSIIDLFTPQVMEKLNLQVLDLWVFSEFAILECFWFGVSNISCMYAFSKVLEFRCDCGVKLCIQNMYQYSRETLFFQNIL